MSASGGGEPAALRFRFPKALRLLDGAAFEAVYGGGRRKIVGPLDVLARPNDLDHPRLGLSVPRRVGNAVVRNRVKRMLREAFRRLQHDLPRGYDLVINVRRHEPLALPQYEQLLEKAMIALHAQWTTPTRQNDGSRSERE
jgi:ribonuclease P protein component